MTIGKGRYEIIPSLDEVFFLIHKGEVEKVFAGCVIHSLWDDILMIHEEKKPYWRVPGGGVRLESESVFDGVAREISEEAEHHISIDGLLFLTAFLTDDDSGKGYHLKVFFTYDRLHGWSELSDEELSCVRCADTEKVDYWGVFSPEFIQSDDGGVSVDFGTHSIVPDYKEVVKVSSFHLRAIRHFLYQRARALGKMQRENAA